MNWDTIEGNWKQFRGKVQQKWGELTDDDLDVIDGKRTELIGRIQERYGKTREAAEREVREWERREEGAEVGS
ncbi:MAG: CsbD family protein [Gemmatimonadota bacterium]